VVLMIDGIHFGDQVLVVALGIARFEARLHLPSVYPPRTGRLPGEGSWPTSMGCLPPRCSGAPACAGRPWRVHILCSHPIMLRA